MSESKRLIYDLSFEELEQVVSEWGEPAYRAKQIWEGVYKHFWNDPEQFSPLSKALRSKLAQAFKFNSLSPNINLTSSDGSTRKILFKLQDEQAIEAVLMRYGDDRRTLCISTQAGCAMGCVFCATGQMGFRRHLTTGEIVEQVLYYARQLAQEDQQVTNIVMMGMGEPFHNYDATMQAIDRLNDPTGMGLGARRFTISTVGLIPMIERFAEEKRQVNLAISLHATDDKLRSEMLPINDKYPIKDLIKACHDYVERTGRRVTFEWALIHNENDSPEQAQALAALLKGLLCHVNVIPLNPTAGYAGEKSSKDRVRSFCDTLESKGIPCTIRVRRGIDIQAGCGQLAITAE
ncbi:MAG: 23S rRNA (adenine(2503)-C(2))-methyltransferase RlmN [Chloroflexi bacterium]|nr:MAG: 23S rRNA (adenine(2503)-C(2))-methyltransferase RlmN [Chloroflexota bacterium]MBL1196094.1 23S rRNA (adenine(2503)-C(2))-methyltransferase RlmN [Chloroflexota bacterium]NOH13387.1 23S rRNA (adenine(2503)-C(2))-methyltransferase RlmN [Chloroflexota bacterium]